MKLLNIILIIFIALTNEIKADSKNQLFEKLQKGGNLIFIRHAYAPGNGDPDNFDIKDCSTQRNLSDSGRKQSEKIGNFFNENKIPIDLVISSEWCRCKETALIAFDKFKTKNFLNSFYSSKFSKNKTKQMKDLKRYIGEFKSEKNLILVTHYVVISELLDYSSSSGEIIVSNKSLNLIGAYKTKY